MDTLIYVGLNAIGYAAIMIIGCGKKKKPTSQKGTPTAATKSPARPNVAPTTAESAPAAPVEPSVKDKTTQKTEDEKSKVAKAEEKDKLEPKKAKLNEKEKLIAKGQTRNKADYPTMDDIMSDWTDDKNAQTKEKVAATQEEGDDNPEEAKEKKDSKEAEKTKKGDEPDPDYETFGPK